MPVLGHPPLRNLTRQWLTSHLPGAKQGEVMGGRGGAPAGRISFVSLVAYGPKVFYSALAMGGLQLLKPGRAVPNKRIHLFMKSQISILLNRLLLHMKCSIYKMFQSIYLDAQILLNLSTGNTFRLLSGPLDLIPSIFEKFCTFGTKRCSRLILVFCPSPDIRHFFKENGFFFFQKVFRS